MSETGHASVDESAAPDAAVDAAPAESSRADGACESVVAAADPGTSAECPARRPAVDPKSVVPQRHTWFGLSRGDTWFALVVGSAILVLMLIHWAQLTWRGQPRVEIDRLEAAAYEFQLDINRAAWVEWMQLEDIGETLARRIVADRETNGPFRSIDDLNRVSGIGPKTLDAIRPHLRCPACPTPTETTP
jgi:competence protein ComEA